MIFIHDVYPGFENTTVTLTVKAKRDHSWQAERMVLTSAPGLKHKKMDNTTIQQYSTAPK